MKDGQDMGQVRKKAEKKEFSTRLEEGSACVGGGCLRKLVRPNVTREGYGWGKGGTGVLERRV